MTESTAPVSFRQKILSKEIKRAHAMQVRYEDLHVEPGFNLRTPIELLDGEEREQAEADDEALFQHIMAGGKIPPLEVRPRPQAGVWIVDGHRRHAQIGRAIAAGANSAGQEELEVAESAHLARPVISGQVRQRNRKACSA